MSDNTDIETRIRQIDADLGVIRHNLQQVMDWIREHIRHTETQAAKTEADRRYIRNIYDA